MKNKLDNILGSTDGESDNQKILYNAIRTPDGTILHSKHVHDYITYTDKNGYEYMIDGGNEYLRYNVVKEAPPTFLTVYDDGKHETRRQYIYWGVNYTKEMILLPKTLWKPIMELNTDHIQAILDGNYGGEHIRELLKEELNYRLKNV